MAPRAQDQEKTENQLPRAENVAPREDVAGSLARVTEAAGRDDIVTQVMEVNEAIERAYRLTLHQPAVGGYSTTANG